MKTRDTINRQVELQQRIDELEAQVKEMKAEIDRLKGKTHDPYCFVEQDGEKFWSERLVNKLEAQTRYHHPDCNWWKWDWLYSWDVTDCNCSQVAAPAALVEGEI